MILFAVMYSSTPVRMCRQFVKHRRSPMGILGHAISFLHLRISQLQPSEGPISCFSSPSLPLPAPARQAPRPVFLPRPVSPAPLRSKPRRCAFDPKYRPMKTLTHRKLRSTSQDDLFVWRVP